MICKSSTNRGVKEGVGKSWPPENKPASIYTKTPVYEPVM